MAVINWATFEKNLGFNLYGFQQTMLSDLIDGMEALENMHNVKHEFAVQGATGCGKTRVLYAYTQYLLWKYRDSKLAVFYISPSNGGLPYQTKQIMEDLDGARIEDVDSLMAYGVIDKAVYCFGHAKVNKKNNKMTFEDFRQKILDASAEGFKLVVLIDEAHSDKNMVNNLSKLPFDQTIYVSATLPSDIMKRLNVTRDDKKSYWNKLVVDREVVRKAGLIKDPIYINPEDYINNKTRIEAEKLARKHGIYGNEDLCEDFYLVYVAHKMITKMQHVISALRSYRLYDPRTGEVFQYKLPCMVLLLPDNRRLGAKTENKKETETDIERIVRYALICGFTKEQIGIWTATCKENVDNLPSDDSTVTLLISKQAIKEGWDCPRCFGMVKLRDVSTWTFEVQVAGRITRNPLLSSYDQIMKYSKNKEILCGKDRAVIKKLLKFVFTPYVFTFSKEFEKELYNIYNEDMSDGLLRQRSEGKFNKHMGKSAVEVYNKLVVLGTKTRNHKNIRHADESMFLSMLSADFVDYMEAHMQKVKAITNKTVNVVRRSELNAEHLKDNYCFCFENLTQYYEGRSDGDVISVEKDNLVKKDSKVKTQFRSVDVKSLYEKTSSILGCTVESSRVFWRNVVSQGKLEDGDRKLLFLGENDSMFFLHTNKEKLLTWLISYVMTHHQNLLTFYTPNKYPLNITSDCFLPYWDRETKEPLRKNHFFADTRRKAVTTIRGKLSYWELRFEDDILERHEMSWFNWLKNGTDGDPFYALAYRKDNRVVKPQGFVGNFALNNAVLSTYHNFYPDYCTCYKDEATKTIYLSFIETKLPFGLCNNNSCDELSQKFSAMVDEQVRVAGLYKGYVTSDGYTVKVSYSFIRKADDSTDNSDYYVLYADSQSKCDDAKAYRVPTDSWIKFSSNEELFETLKSHAK